MSNENIIDEFKSLYDPVKEKFKILPEKISALIDFSEKQVKENTELSAKVNEIAQQFDELKKEYESKKENMTSLEQELTKYKDQLKSVEEQMEKFRKMYEEVAQERAKELDLQELMAIYSVLFEQVFAANPHTKILLLLQGTDKEEWTRDEIVKTTGYSPAAILKALYDLRNNGIIELDESAKKIKLVKKIL